MNTYLESGRFLDFIGVLVQATFSFRGIELVGVAASETRNPRRNITKAISRVFYPHFNFISARSLRYIYRFDHTPR